MSANRGNDDEAVNWSEIHRWRQQFRKAFPRIQRLPILPSVQAWLIPQIKQRHSEKGSAVRLLDVGAGDRQLPWKLDAVKDLVVYKSQDIDQGGKHDYYDTKDITETFDIVVSTEVIEHLDAAGKCKFVDEMFRLTNPGGWLAVSTPNANHPNIFWRDFTHVMPIHYYDLAGLLGRAGCTDISVYRLAKMNWKKRLTVWRYKALLDLLHSDFAQSILAVGRRAD